MKSILPQRDADDGRPVLFKRDPRATGLISVLGGKVDHIYELDDALKDCLADHNLMSTAVLRTPARPGMADVLVDTGPSISREGLQPGPDISSISAEVPEDLVP